MPNLHKNRHCFNPRAPCGARHRAKKMCYSDSVFQSTRPLRGATRHVYETVQSADRFNPRAPCRARQQPVFQLHLRDRVSIHAPLAGRDRDPVRPRDRKSFQSTRPLRGATRDRRQRQSTVAFQSTRPLRGATSSGMVGLLIARGFNPRAPCGARPRRSGRKIGYAGGFNPRARRYPRRHALRFQSTRPLRGATLSCLW